MGYELYGGRTYDTAQFMIGGKMINFYEFLSKSGNPQKLLNWAEENFIHKINLTGTYIISIADKQPINGRIFIKINHSQIPIAENCLKIYYNKQSNKLIKWENKFKNYKVGEFYLIEEEEINQIINKKKENNIFNVYMDKKISFNF